MKKKIIIAMIAAAILLGGSFAVGAANLGLSIVEPTETEGKKEMISADKAEQIASSEVEGKVESVELERKNGKLYYEVEIENGAVDYDVYVDAYTGEILSIEQDNDDSNVAPDDNIQTNDDKKAAAVKTANSKKTNLITLEQAIQIAEKAVNGKVYSVEKDDDEYELELKTDKGEVEIEIHAETGKIIEIDYDDDDDDD